MFQVPAPSSRNVIEFFLIQKSIVLLLFAPLTVCEPTCYWYLFTASNNSVYR